MTRNDNYDEIYKNVTNDKNIANDQICAIHVDLKCMKTRVILVCAR